MNQDINLNIHYNLPREFWVKIETVYASMPDDICEKWYSIHSKK